MKFNVSAIVVTFNRLEMLKQNLKCLLCQNYTLSNIFVVNNNSDDGTENYLDNIKSSIIKPINMNKNLGGAGGFNNGLKIAFENSHSDLFWIMDDDALPDKGALLNLVNNIKPLNNNFGFLCSNVRWWNDKSAAIDNVPSVSRDWNNILLPNLVKIKSSSFVSLLIPKNIIIQIGFPISDMFIWGDDVEFTRRISNYNSRCYFVKNSIVYHKSLVNKDYDINNTNRIKFYKYGYRNSIYINKKKGFPFAVRKVLTILYKIAMIPFKAKNKRIERIWYSFQGIISGLFFHPKIEFPNKRK